MFAFARNVFFLLSLLLFSCTPAVNHPDPCDEDFALPADDAPRFAENVFGDPLYWDLNAFPLRVVIDEDMSGNRANIVMNAIQSWNDSVGFQVFTAERGPSSYYGMRDVIFIEEARIPRGACGETILGLATRTYGTNMFGVPDRIEHATIILSDEVRPEQAINTAIHELGHALGLMHCSDINDVMYPYNENSRGGITDSEIDYVIRMMTRPEEDILRVPPQDVSYNPLGSQVSIMNFVY